jgi:hypothetical protein
MCKELKVSTTPVRKVPWALPLHEHWEELAGQLYAALPGTRRLQAGSERS